MDLAERTRGSSNIRTAKARQAASLPVAIQEDAAGDKVSVSGVESPGVLG